MPEERYREERSPTFPGHLRYSGGLLGYQLASIIAGGPAPLIAAWLFATYHTPYAIALYIAACTVISLVATAMMSDFTGKSIDHHTPGTSREGTLLRYSS